jgi:dihydrolipoamide dehydrogenase
VYAGLGSKVTVVEILPNLLTGVDPDLVQIVQRAAAKQLSEILLEARIESIERTGAGYAVRIQHKGEVKTREFARIMTSVGRLPNTEDLGLENAPIRTDARGFIPVDAELRTTAPDIFAIGDITAGPMLAHRASRQGKVAAEVIAGQPVAFDNRAMPAVVFTDPEIAWTGLSELEAKSQEIAVSIGKFPLAALGRAKTMGRTDGFAKILFDPATKQVLGAGIVAVRASDLITEATLAVEMGATLEDLVTTIHPHPTLSEAVMEAAEVAAGAAVHIFTKRA